MEYFSFKRAKKHQDKVPAAETPVLDDEDEAFLKRITTQVEGTPPALPERPLDGLSVAGDPTGNDMQLILADEAREVPLPDAPETPEGVKPDAERSRDVAEDGKAKGKGKEKERSKSRDANKNRWSFLQKGKEALRRKSSHGAEKHKADDGKAEDSDVPKTEAQKEEEEMAQVLDQLNLAAIDNQAFSLSKESQELLKKFTLVFKDLVNGVPTAYHDLESLLTNSEDQLQGMFKGMPSFIQKLVEKLPEKFTSHLGPEVLAAAAEKTKMNMAGATAASGASTPKVKLRVPSLKELVMKRGALVGMLRSIMAFLRTRFPAVLGLNVLWSLALFLLLLVCWYCHKRGREVRLEKERQLTAAEMEAIRQQVEADAPGEYHGGLTTTAPDGAALDEVRAGIRPAGEVRDGDGPAPYAEGGSLAQALREGDAAGAGAAAGAPEGKGKAPATSS